MNKSAKVVTSDDATRLRAMEFTVALLAPKLSFWDAKAVVQFAETIEAYLRGEKKE